MWPLSTVVLDVGQYRAGHSQLNESGAALATISEMPGHANRKMRSGNANSIKWLAKRNTFLAAFAVVRAGGRRREMTVWRWQRKEARILSLCKIPVVARLLGQWKGAPSPVDPRGPLVRIFPRAWEEKDKARHRPPAVGVSITVIWLKSAGFWGQIQNLGIEIYRTGACDLSLYKTS